MPIECFVYIAVSVDGFIARSDGDVEWLHNPAYALPKNEDCGYGKFIASIDTLVMGRRSFEKVLSFSDWPYDDIPVVVLSGRDLQIPANLETKVQPANSTPHELVARLEAEGMRRLYIDGGETIRRFIRADLIDEMTITQIPILLGEGISLFAMLGAEVTLKCQHSQTYDNGFVQTTYRVDH